ncbi:FecR domain-containing protein [Nitrosovibrio tenuis]|uniref:FecR family protein n=1 Tax=Nitrosovibrio tenuis TaxID=1233 RepID=A0A1H7KU27_9PROT|nr:FecR family protein [Nitrosovibrio tenuis]SEK90331.1 FecR family protein [Nitrosovibrio tenuis]
MPDGLIVYRLRFRMPMHSPKTPTPPSTSKTHAFSWSRFFVHCSIVVAAVSLGFASWFIAKPTATRLHQTIPGQRLTITATPDIDISLDTDSTVTVTNTEPPRIELLRGNAYFDIKSKSADKLQVKVGTTYIKDIGTRFSIRKQADGGSVAVAEGQVEIQVEAGTYLVSSRERADFDGTRVTGHKMIAEAEVAPWRVNK